MMKNDDTRLYHMARRGLKCPSNCIVNTIINAMNTKNVILRINIISTIVPHGEKGAA